MRGGPARAVATRIPRSHPRRASLLTRERMRQALRRGIIHETGLIAHGRGEAFDYLLGERTGPAARGAVHAAAQALRNAQRPVVSANGNVVALAAREVVRVGREARARLEVNLFHRTEARVRRLVRELERAGARDVLGPRPDARIPGLDSDRAKSHSEGVWGADVVLVPLEDGDRAEALRRMGKYVIAIDLNPLSRTARAAHITIVDEVRRALGALADELARQPLEPRPARPRFDNARNLRASLREIARHLRAASDGRGTPP
jgi:4-phosphopantoate---beta-alanine ligase